MKVVILAGGYGTRISEETMLKPKPMVEIGGRPLLWHIMKYYSHFGINDFVICLGYKGYLIKEYFSNYQLYMSDVTFDMQDNKRIIHNDYSEPWKVTLVDTGIDSMTGGRLKRIYKYVQDEEAFCMTYGDGISNVDLQQLIQFHKSHNKLVTLTAIRPPERFGVLECTDNNTVVSFKEKTQSDTAYINGGFFVMSPKSLQYIEGDNISWEKQPLEAIAREGQLKAYKHNDFWQCMDTLRDKNLLEQLWHEERAPWKIWD